MKKDLYALVDCSAFYCSCERAFRPDLEGRPIVVLSNNDGCVISLTPDAKALGVKMGTPYYQVKDQLDKLGIAVFSSNYCLYGDMSRRVVRVIREYSDMVEQYSIDEAFVRFEVDPTNVEVERERMQKIAESMHLRILKGTGIPVRVSIAETKTLAKVGSEFSKALLKEGKLPAVCFWEHPQKAEIMSKLPVEDVWGIGRRWSKKLGSQGILMASDLASTHPRSIRKSYNVVMERTVVELSGTPCIPLELIPPASKSMVRSRMFKQKLNDPVLIAQAVATHASRAGQKLRRNGQLAHKMTVFITTGRHGSNLKYSSKSEVLLRPTNDTLVLTKVAERLFNSCYVRANVSGREYMYSKAGVMLDELTPISTQSCSLFAQDEVDKVQLMRTLDAVNRRFGKYSLVVAAGGLPDKLKRVESAKKGSVEWGMKREKMSPRYTTVLSEVMTAKL